LIAAAIIASTACVQPPDNKGKEKPSDDNKSQGIYSNANRLFGDYKWKLDLVIEIQKRTDVLGTDAPKELYVEWKLRNNEAIDAGERLATYITENRQVLDYYWTSDVLVLIAKNKVTFERDNKALDQMIYSLENPKKLYKWQIEYYGREGSRDLGTLIFTNSGRTLLNVKFRFTFYKSSGDLYSVDSLPIGDIASGKIVRKKVSLPGRYTGEETWSRETISVYINGTVKESWVYENGEWMEQEVNLTDKTRI
jgi:hypothetical protein